MTTELETNIVAVERVKEYTETPTEVNMIINVTTKIGHKLVVIIFYVSFF